MSRAINRLAGWPGTPKNFVTITNHTIDQALDTADSQLDSSVATAVAGSPARWVPDLVGVLNLFVVSAIPDYTFSDTLNAWGDFLNRVVRPFKIVSSASTFGVITPYKIMAAAVAGAATVLTDMLNNVYDPAQWEIDVIYVTTGATVTRSDLSDSTTLETKIAASVALGGGVYSTPTEAFDLTLPTWTAAQVNPFTVATYVVLVGLYKRFQEMAALTTFTTSTQYNSGTPYTIDLGSASTRSEYANGTFTAVDGDGNPVSFAPADGNTYTSAWGALVTINTYSGGYTYTATLPGAAYFHAGAAGAYDTVQIPVTSADGAPYTLTFQVKIVSTTNTAPTVSTTVGTADALGVVRGTVNGSDAEGDTLTYSLVSSSVSGLSGNSAKTSNGGIVTLNSSTGVFTYTSTTTGGTSASFQMQVDDGHGGTVTQTVTVPNTTSITPANVNTATIGVVTGSVPAPGSDAGMYTYSLAGGPAYGTVTFDASTGAFTYTRTASGHTEPAADSFTVLATDANGRSVTLKMTVQPTIADTAPTITGTTTSVGSTDTTKWGLNTSTWTQTTTGKLTATDADGDTLTYSLVDGSTHAAVTTTTNGGTVTFNADGSYTYSITKNQAYFHGAAKIGATGTAVADSFTVAVSDGYGGVAYTTITMPIYAVNSPPVITGFGSLACAFYLCTVGTMTISDPDGDSIPEAKITAGTGAGYTLATGSVTSWGSGVTTISWTAGGTFGTTATANTFTVYDGYYTVTNGVTNTSSPATFWVSYAAASGTRTTGN
ncbi:hypothetical protein CRM90_16255 [Mycobacterium sp. ENV421]|uniref:Ig-like domain-containing protein n=1 Tax=Mycobacterium sp. ENV421 TaxID=1213407 RepID=UPI000C9A2F20|nr:Ig-like domain-containing protein [Mycobacterium sp. ENV421]PND56732.1 hypothetical protein CRM90_16255 [Mycobacterium sp. ENV421]